MPPGAAWSRHHVCEEDQDDQSLIRHLEVKPQLVQADWLGPKASLLFKASNSFDRGLKRTVEALTVEATRTMHRRREDCRVLLSLANAVWTTHPSGTCRISFSE